MIPGQPRDAAVALAQHHAVTVRGKIVEQLAVRDRHAMREARRSARILQIGDVVGRRLRQRAGRRWARGEILVGEPLDITGLGGGMRHRGELGRVEQHPRIGALQLHRELVDIGFAPAEAGRQRQRHRPGAGIDRAKEQRGEVRAGLGHQRQALARTDARLHQPVGRRDRVFPQRGIGIGVGQRAACVVEVQATHAARSIIQRFAQRCEIAHAARQCVFGRG